MVNHTQLSRFTGFSDSIDIRRLEYETIKILYLGLLVGIVFHVALFSFVTFKKTEVKVFKPIQVELVIRPPRMRKPYIINRREFLKRTIRKRFMMRMPSGTFKLKSLPSPQEVMEIVGDIDASISPETMRELIAEIAADMDSVQYAEIKDNLEWELYFHWEDFIIAEEIAREDTNYISLKEEMITVDDLDSGDFKALVIKDPENKQNVKGFIHIPVDIWGTTNSETESLEPAEYAKKAMIALSEGFTRFTGITVKTDNHLYLDSPDIINYPFIYITSDKLFTLTETERKNLADFFMNGGFALVEPYNPPDSEIELYPQKGFFSLREMVIDALGGYGGFFPIPPDHPIFRCFFNIDVAPVLIPKPGDYDLIEKLPFLNGIWLDNRLVGIFSDNEYGKTWSGYNFDNPFFRVGVNMIVYSLIRQESVAKKYINSD